MTLHTQTKSDLSPWGEWPERRCDTCPTALNTNTDTPHCNTCRNTPQPDEAA